MSLLNVFLTNTCGYFKFKQVEERKKTLCNVQLHQYTNNHHVCIMQATCLACTCHTAICLKLKTQKKNNKRVTREGGCMKRKPIMFYECNKQNVNSSSISSLGRSRALADAFYLSKYKIKLLYKHIHTSRRL